MPHSVTAILSKLMGNSGRRRTLGNNSRSGDPCPQNQDPMKPVLDLVLNVDWLSTSSHAVLCRWAGSQHIHTFQEPLFHFLLHSLLSGHQERGIPFLLHTPISPGPKQWNQRMCPESRGQKSTTLAGCLNISVTVTEKLTTKPTTVRMETRHS